MGAELPHYGVALEKRHSRPSVTYISAVYDIITSFRQSNLFLRDVPGLETGNDYSSPLGLESPLTACVPHYFLGTMTSFDDSCHASATEEGTMVLLLYTVVEALNIVKEI